MLGEFYKRMRRHSDALLAVGVVGLVLLLIIPLPPILLDIFLCFSIVLSVMTLLLTLYIDDALDFSSFPSLLLFLTLYRLGLNISSTRLILTRGEGGDIINTFGSFVTSGSMAVGLVLFALLTVINFIVVTKGAGRIAEVAARFTLEALPGQQSAIDSELNSGMLTQNEAKTARVKVNQEANFYGAMDGASKFVRGDAIASLVITGVNIIGGLVLGFVVKGMGWQECLATFTRLTVGDGLVTQIPALLVSVGAGIMVTRSSSGNLGKNMTKEIFRQPKVMMIAATTILCLGFVRGMPFWVMFPMALVLFGIGWIQLRGKNGGAVSATPTKEKKLFVYPLEVQFGYQAISLAGGLHTRLKGVREKVANDLGLQMPAVEIADNLDLSPTGWAICVKGSRVASGRDADVVFVVKTLEEVVRSHAHELINRQAIAQMVHEVKSYDPAVVDELIPKKLSLGQVLRVTKNLLKESVPIRDFVTILEQLADHATQEIADIDALTESVRQGLSRGISETFFGRSRHAHVITVDPKVEQMLDLAKGNLLPKVVDSVAKDLLKLHKCLSVEGIKPVVVTVAPARMQLKKIIEKHLPQTPVLSYQEVSSDIELETVGTISHEVLSGN